MRLGRPKAWFDGCWRSVDGATTSIRHGTAPRVPVPVAVGASVLAIALGNGVVLAKRWLSPAQGEVVTTIALPLAGAASSLTLITAGWSRRDVGWTVPSARDLGRVRPFAGCLAVALGVAMIATAIRGGTYKDVDARLTMLRLVVGTALGEELIHRGVLFPLWAATGVSTRTVVIANGAVFGLWHVAGAAPEGWLGGIGEVAGPALVGAPVFLWARSRSGSMLAPALAHLATNLPGVVGKVWSRPA